MLNLVYLGIRKMGSKLSCVGTAHSVTNADLPKWIEIVSDIISKLLDKHMTQEGYLLQEFLERGISQDLTLSKEEQCYFTKYISEIFKESSKDIQSSTRWIFRINNYENRIFEVLESLTEDQYVSVTLYKEYYSFSDTQHVMSMFGYFLSSKETPKDEIIDLFGEDCFVFPPSVASVKGYDDFLYANGDVKIFGNEEIRSAISCEN